MHLITVAYYYPPAFLKPKMVSIPGNNGAVWKYGDNGYGVGTATTVAIPAFEMSETPVTQAQFEYIMGTTPCRFSCGGSGAFHIACRPTSALPVEWVSWYDAITYCNKLSLLEGKTPCYSISSIDTLNLTTNGLTGWKNIVSGNIPTIQDANWNAATCNFAANGYRLATESEWEYAARGGTADKHPVFSGSYFVGDYSTAAASDSLSLVAWFNGNNGSPSGCADPYYGTKPVKTKRANVFGLYDMSGNVFEWCWNWINETFPMATPIAAVVSAGSTYRVSRGGSWDLTAFNSRVSNRYNIYPYSHDYSAGFRVVLAP